MKRNALTIISGLLAVMFTVYIALDTFVISHAYVVIAQPTATATAEPTNTVVPAQEPTWAENTAGAETTAAPAATATATATPAPVITDTSYEDGNINITLTTTRVNGTTVYTADIVLSSPEYLKTALAKNTYGKNVTETTSAMAEENGAILAINGDYYGVQERGYVIRNGVIYRSTSRGDQEDLVIYTDGSMAIINERNVTAQQLLDAGAYNLLCFGPGLVKNGSISVSVNDEVDQAMTSNPRTAIGIIDELHYVFVVADGRTSSDAGLSLYQLAQYMQGLGVTTAYNLDGGGSSTLYFNGEVINNPTTTGTSGKGGRSGRSSSTSERSVSDIVYIGY